MTGAGAPETRTGGRARTSHGAAGRWLGLARAWVVLVLVAFALNVVWEFAQAPLYEGGEELAESIYLQASANDAALIAAAVIVALVARRRSTAAFWIVLVVALAATAAFIEVRAILTDRWSYSELMPTVGIIGLSPQLQLPLLGALTAALTRPWAAGGRARG
jgi:hypothetical protein